MKRVLLILSLVLMAVSLASPFWVGWNTNRQRVSGRVSGDFEDYPWAGTVVYLGDQRADLKADGQFAFDVSPGIYLIRVCCSRQFDEIRWEVEVKDEDLHVNLFAQPLLEIPGRLVIPEGKQLQGLASIGARRLYTTKVRRTLIPATGTFSLRLTKGQWKVNVEDLSEGLTLKSIVFDGKEIKDDTITIPAKQESISPLEITLQ